MEGTHKNNSTTMAVGVSDEVKGFAELASLLWRERETLERVLFKIVEEQLVVASGETRWLAASNREVEAAVHDLRVSEVERAAEVDAMATQLGLPAGLSLAVLAENAPAPWDEILRDHRASLSRLLSEIDAAAKEARRLLEAGGRAVQEALHAIDAGDGIDRAVRGDRTGSTGERSAEPVSPASDEQPMRLDRQA